MSRSCVIVGAGPAGLAAAQRLHANGVKVTVLEASNAIGGRTRSERVGDFTVNTGASFLTTFYDYTLALLKTLGLETIAPATQLGSLRCAEAQGPGFEERPRSTRLFISAGQQ